MQKNVASADFPLQSAICAQHLAWQRTDFFRRWPFIKSLRALSIWGSVSGALLCGTMAHVIPFPIPYTLYNL